MEIKRTKEEAQQELIKKFGLKKTSDFQIALQQGKKRTRRSEKVNFSLSKKDKQQACPFLFCSP